MKVQILVDNPNSWIIPFAEDLVVKIRQLGHDAALINRHDEVVQGDILCLLSCEKIFRKLKLNKHNLVVHESDLPKGKGWSPVTWQVLEGKDEIPVTLFEAVEAVDAGPIYAKEYMELDGTELLTEIKAKQGLATQKLILDFVKKYPNIKGAEQRGDESFYPRRTVKDSEVDIKKSIKEQFDLLRVCDNERYPAHFTHRNQRYIIKIYKEND
ncbi:formyltransferase family protein [Phaeodactylibacter xiamenensis]|uniref:formyltransferase family protein n=1 Tax=Phaeodactylibacter xiamenensis TaxID=1524460 RepID=UPI0024A8C25C|nr:formyltransferase family protein [Phaeodactylibacter xiamenensis]